VALTAVVATAFAWCVKLGLIASLGIPLAIGGG
jgi:hypothetical protein